MKKNENIYYENLAFIDFIIIIFFIFFFACFVSFSNSGCIDDIHLLEGVNGVY